MKTRVHALLRGFFLPLLACSAIQAQTATPPDDHGNTYTTATNAALPSSKTGSLGTAGDVDYFKFTLNAPAVVTVTSGGTTDVVGRLWLGASKGAPTDIYADNDSAGVPNFRLSQQLPAGTHYVAVNAAVYGTLGAYTVNFAVAAPSTQQPDITVGHNSANLPAGTLVDFGTASIAQAVSRDFIIGNAGNADLSLYSLRLLQTGTLPAGASSPFRITTLPSFTQQPGRQSLMRVTFQASVAGTYNFKLVIVSNDGDEIFYEIPLRGIASGTLPQPEIAVRNGTTEVANNGSIALGATTVNTRLTKTITIANTGAGELRLSNAVMTQTGSTSTAITVYNSTVPSVIPAGAQASFQVALFNLVAGSYASKLTITTNDSNENPTVINFTGTVNADPTPVEIAVSTGGNDVPTGSTVSYGNQLTGTNTTKDYLISNTGTGELRITSWSLALPPVPTVSVATTTVSGSATGLVTSAANLAPGMVVSGPFPSGTTIVSIAGTSVTFSAAATSTVTNANLVYYVGGTSATVQAFRVEGGVPVSIPAGGSATLRLAYQPLQAGDHAAIFRAFNNDANENPFVINLSGHADANQNPGDIALSLSSGDVALNSTIDWGEAPVNTMTTKTFTITNSGTGDLRLTGFSCLPVQPTVSTTTPTYFLYGSIPSTTAPIAPGGTASFTMMFRPSAAGTVYKALMTVSSTDPDEGSYKVNLQGTGAANTNPVPDIEVLVNGGVVASGGTFAFGNSNSGVLNQKSLTIRNVGAATLTVSALQAGLPVGSPAGAPNPWSVWATPVTLAPGGSGGGYVNFAPTLAGNYSG
ncbi:MAG: choice-of-anchor D domain-containing protein, partial [Prosthecobacter sp.]